MTRDLTIGKPSKVLWLFCIPLFGSILFQQLYTIADSLVAGRFIGEDALAAIGNSYEITLVYLAFAFGCNMGCSVIVSRLFGQKHINKLKTAVYTALISTFIVCIILTGLGLLLGKSILILINTPSNILDDSLLYLNIYTYSVIFVFIYNLSTGIFTALGDSKTPFIFLAISSISNIGLDILFVLKFNMGIGGVAWATFICQGVSAIISFVLVLIRIKGLAPEDKDIDKPKSFDTKLLKEMLVIAIPSILQQSLISVGNILIQSVINSFGSQTVAGYSAAIKLQNLVITSITVLGNGISNYTAQNLGAGKPNRLRPGFKAGLIMTFILIIPFTFIYIFLGKYLLQLFLDPKESSEAIAIAMNFFYIVCPFYFVVSTKIIADGILRGSAKMGMFMGATFLDLFLRTALAFLFPYVFHMGSSGIWAAWPIGWTLAAIVSVILYLYITKKEV